MENPETKRFPTIDIPDMPSRQPTLCIVSPRLLEENAVALESWLKKLHADATKEATKYIFEHLP
jgi:hypothetical protein